MNATGEATSSNFGFLSKRSSKVRCAVDETGPVHYAGSLRQYEDASGGRPGRRAINAQRDVPGGLVLRLESSVPMAYARAIIEGACVEPQRRDKYNPHRRRHHRAWRCPSRFGVFAGGGNPTSIQIGLAPVAAGSRHPGKRPDQIRRKIVPLSNWILLPLGE